MRISFINGFLFYNGTIIVNIRIYNNKKGGKDSNMNDNILTIKDTAKYLKMGTSTIYKLILRGDLPAIKVGSKWRIRKNRLDQWIEEKENCNRRHESLVLKL